jgi:hypothetical protein
MTVYFVGNIGVYFPGVDHWDSFGSDWVELVDENGGIVAVLSWRNVLYIDCSDQKPDNE